MAIADTIQSMYDNVSDTYDTLELGGADLTNVNKNLENISDQLKDRYLDYMNNGTSTIWNNWEKVTGEGEVITLNNTEHAPIKLDLKGNTSQVQYSGKNFMPPLTNETKSDVSISQSGTTIEVDGTSSAAFNSTKTETILKAGTYRINKRYVSGSVGATLQFIIRNKATNTDIAGLNATTSNYQEDINGSFTLSEDTEVQIYIYVGGADRTFTHYKMNVQITQSASADYDFEPYCGGTPSPNPDYPQDIHSVSGDNEIEVCGKNLIKTIGNKVGNAIYFNGVSVKETYPFKAGTFTFSYKDTNNISTYIYDKAGNQTNLGQNKTITFTSNEDFNIWVYRSNITIEELSEVQLERNSQATSYSPYTGATYPINLGSIELNKIGTYQDTFIKTSGKNLTDISEYLGGSMNTSGQIGPNAGITSFTNTNGVITFTTNTQYRGTYSNYIEIKPSTSYVISYAKMTTGITYLGWCYWYDANKTFISREGISTSSLTSPINAKYCIIFLAINEIGTASISNIMLEESNTMTEYEPYGTNEWYLKKEIGEITLNGSENWDEQSIYASLNKVRFRYQNSISSLPITTSTIPSIYSNYFVPITPDNQWMGQQGVSLATAGTGIFILDDDYNSSGDLASFKTWLSTHNTKVNYVLANPTYTKITGVYNTLHNQLEEIYKNARSQENTTNVTQANNDLPFKITAIALKKV